jgi:hypothetical protein
MKKRIYEVKDPIYLTKEKIREKYWDKQILLTNVRMTLDFGRMDGGIVRYYASDAKDELYKKLKELRETEGDDVIESCGVEYIGNIYLNLYAGGDNF